MRRARPLKGFVLFVLVSCYLLFIWREHAIYNIRVEIPRVIWQAYFDFGPTSTGIEEYAHNIATWKERNPGWQYHLFDDRDAYRHLDSHLHGSKDLKFYESLGDGILRIDLFRYLLLYTTGGVWTDLDTRCVKPIDDWIPPSIDPKKVNLVVGPELDEPDWAGNKAGFMDFSFCQWTLLARPGHRSFLRVFKKARVRLEQIAAAQGVPVSEVKLNQEEVISVTGPAMWSVSLLEELQYQLGREVKFHDFTGLKEPTLFGDVLILPINAFGAGQSHSNSGPQDGDDVYIQHQFRGAWRKARPAMQMSPEDVADFKALVDISSSHGKI